MLEKMNQMDHMHKNNFLWIQCCLWAFRLAMESRDEPVWVWALQSRGPLKDPFMNEYSWDQELPCFNLPGLLVPRETNGTLLFVAQIIFIAIGPDWALQTKHILRTAQQNWALLCLRWQQSHLKWNRAIVPSHGFQTQPAGLSKSFFSWSCLQTQTCHEKIQSPWLLTIINQLHIQLSKWWYVHLSE